MNRDEKIIATAINSDPAVLPTIGVRLHPTLRTVAFVTGTFPNVPGCRFDACTYEPSGGFLYLDLIGICLPDDNKLELRHRVRDYPHLIHVTTITAEPSAVEVVGHLELGKDKTGEIPEDLSSGNLCWGFERGPSFAAGGETPELYPKWIARCFIFTDKGRTFLDKTVRRKTVEVPSDDPRNNPPWSEHYVGVWQHATSPPFPANTSPDRYVVPLIGAVSRDGKYLVALASDSHKYIAQAWHTCMHLHFPRWKPINVPLIQRTWREKLYAMENDPDKLLAQVAKDFPEAMKLKEKRVPD